ncbi:CYTH domain-containing protein [Rhizobium sp. BK049]|nr:CYTH domain-containing protein [Rhizobium sp. BK049]
MDVFAGAYQGLTLAEIEMASENDRFNLPQWLGREVTGEKRYSNRAMAAAPRTQLAAQGTAGWPLNPLPQSSLRPD